MADCYDVIVIGAGLGGLTAAAKLAQAAEKRCSSSATTALAEQHRPTNQETSLSRLLFTRPAIRMIPPIPNTMSSPDSVYPTRSSG